MEALLQKVVKTTVGPELRATLRANEALSGLQLKTSSFRGVATSGNPSSQAGGVVISLGEAAAFNTIYSELQKQAIWKWYGGTAAILTDVFVSSPSFYPVTSFEYIEYLQTAKRNLESRVSELETRLNEIQVYLPTMKKLIVEHKSATARVESFVKDLTTKYGSRSALEMAKRRDVLAKPPADLFDEVE
jgi:uncharacterized coiled-coil protein SlyX